MIRILGMVFPSKSSAEMRGHQAKLDDIDRRIKELEGVLKDYGAERRLDREARSNA